MQCTTISEGTASGMVAVLQGYEAIIKGTGVVVVGGTEKLSQAHLPTATSTQEDDNLKSVRFAGAKPYRLKSAEEVYHHNLEAQHLAEFHAITPEMAAKDAVLLWSNAYSGEFTSDFVRIRTEGPAWDDARDPLQDMSLHAEKGSKSIDADQLVHDWYDIDKAEMTGSGSVIRREFASMADGAAAIVLASPAAVEIHNMRPLAKIVGVARSAVHGNRVMPFAPEAFGEAMSMARIAKCNRFYVNYRGR